MQCYILYVFKIRKLIFSYLNVKNPHTYLCFSLEPQGLLDPSVHVTLHVKPWWLKPADRPLVPFHLMISLQVPIPGLCIWQSIHQRYHWLISLHLIPQLWQQRYCLFLSFDTFLNDNKHSCFELNSSTFSICGHCFSIYWANIPLPFWSRCMSF